MTMKRVAFAVAAIAVVALCWFAIRATRPGEAAGEEVAVATAPAETTTAPAGSVAPARAIVSAAPTVASDLSDDGEETPPQQGAVASEEDGEDEERVVDEFYALTDKWIKPVQGGVSIEEADSFAGSFRKVPKGRKAECLQRALNLVPDENVMLLVGILMDKSQEIEFVEMVYNDVLNRDEEVKKPILQQIFKDKSHPCWADTAWILDVTGELPGKK